MPNKKSKGKEKTVSRKVALKNEAQTQVQHTIKPQLCQGWLPRQVQKNAIPIKLTKKANPGHPA
jgi:hypothetical protein